MLMSWLTGRYLLSGSACVVFVKQPNDNQASSTKHPPPLDPLPAPPTASCHILMTLIDVRVQAEASDKTGYLIKCSQGMVVKHLDIWKWVCLCSMYTLLDRFLASR